MAKGFADALLPAERGALIQQLPVGLVSLLAIKGGLPSFALSGYVVPVLDVERRFRTTVWEDGTVSTAMGWNDGITLGATDERVLLMYIGWRITIADAAQSAYYVGYPGIRPRGAASGFGLQDVAQSNAYAGVTGGGTNTHLGGVWLGGGRGVPLEPAARIGWQGAEIQAGTSATCVIGALYAAEPVA